MKHLFLSLLCAAPLALVPGLSAQDDEVTPEDLVAQWLKTERLIAQEAADWKAEQAHTAQLLALYEDELALLDEELAQAGKNAPTVDEEAENLKARIAASEQARREAIQFLARLQPRVVALFARFPQPLQKQLEDDAFILEREVNNETLDETMRAIVKILQEAGRFNRSYVFEEHLISLKGEDLRAKVMYLGLSRGFFLAGKRAGSATPGDEGWVFRENDKLANTLEKAFLIQEKQVPSALIELPLQR
ncbi:DUF3450 family protein [Roseibacillus ishigakijimensis]|uniref:DUF3450 family protein n=1 Tax=Roseibacillus ishigakijimensis TaxID=454146 RepID=A0A934RMK1_9BACT|nr:DUF3450 family protein [Roseibacillus ishigakijimensis]MBK1834149.1 DUF3450 family protein [Roseibacillus ishigakijimensis]